MNDELQQRAFEIATRLPELRAGDIESSRDELWLRLYEELGWREAAMIDFDLLMYRLTRSMEADHLRAEADRLRAEGWSAADISEFQHARAWVDLVEKSRPTPDQSSDWKRLAGPLDDAIYAFVEGPDDRHPYLQLIPGAADPADVAAMLTRLGAPSMCTVGALGTYLYVKGKGRALLPKRLPTGFDVGSQLPLRMALEIAEEDGWEAVLFCVPRRLAYVQHHEVSTARNQCRAIAYVGPNSR